MQCITAYQRTPVVSKSDLNSSWLTEGIKFNETENSGVKAQCLALHNQTDCSEVYFEESPELASSELIPTVSIRLSHMNIVEKKMEYEPMKILVDIISLETIFFGSNALGMLTTIFLSFSRILRFKWYRAYSLILFLIAGIGFFAHNVLVFQSIISGDLNENEFFEWPVQYSLPSPILCFDLQNEIDENHRITGEYLNDLTGEITL